MLDKLYVSDLVFKNNASDEIEDYIISNNIKNIEMFLEPLDKGHHQKTLEVLERCQFDNISFHGPYRMADISQDGDKMWRDTVESYKVCFDVVKKYNGEFLVLHTNEALDPKTLDKETIKERVAKIVEIGKREGIEVLVENVGTKKNMLFSQEEYTELIVKNGYKSLIDLGHAHINNWDLEKLLKDLDGKVEAYHLHSNDGNTDLHLSILEGNFNFDNFLKLYSEHTSDAKMVLELSPITPKESLILDIKHLKNHFKVS